MATEGGIGEQTGSIKIGGISETMIIGNKEHRIQLEMAMASAITRNSALPHMIFVGAPGCGKTSTARRLAEESGFPFLSVVPDSFKDYKSVIKILNQLNHENYDDKGNRIGIIKPSILFVDEIHRMPVKGQELLGLAMERFIIESDKPNRFLWVPLFTLVGATTLSGELTKPFLSRFKIRLTFEPYSLEDMIKIVRVHAKAKGLLLTPSAVSNVAGRARGTPRVAVGYLDSVRDRMVATGATIATNYLVDVVFKQMGIDENGVTATEMKILKCLLNAGGPVGLDNLCIFTDEDRRTVREDIEPFLIKKGLLVVGGKGRTITEKGIAYIENAGKCDKFIKKEIDFDYERV